MSEFVHEVLPCGIECGVSHLPQRHVIAFQIRILSGTSCESEGQLGLAKLLVETIDKGTQRRSGRELADAFDAIGATYGIGIGRETITCNCSVLPEHFEQAVALHAEFLRTPTFPDDVLNVNIDLAKQELSALEDDAQAWVDKIICRQAFGPPLGRHALGERNALDHITRRDVETFWQSHFQAGRIQVSLAGAVDPSEAFDVLGRHFDGFGNADLVGRDAYSVAFAPSATHQAKDLEQQQVGMCWPGVDVTHDDFSVQQVLLGVLSGGMSSRLFTEVREKQGLVYWVNAWQETPRGCGMIFIGASTMPDRCDQTYETLLREVDRLAEDIEETELKRAVTGIASSLETRGDSTGARCQELANDLFFFGRPRSEQEKIDRIRSVTIGDIKRFLSTYPRDRLCVVTLGPRQLGQRQNKEAIGA